MENRDWNILTVNELRQVLLECNIPCTSQTYIKKNQLAELCEKELGNGKMLTEALERFNKSEKRRHSTSRTPLRKRQPCRVSVSGTRKHISTSPPRFLSPSPISTKKNVKQALHSSLPIPSLSPTRTPGRYAYALEKEQTKDIMPKSIIRAGRFSVPSDDLVVSPYSHAALHSSAMHDGVNLHGQTDFPQPIVPSCEKSQPVPYHWPAVDPQGNPICWRIRDPFVVNLNTISQANVSKENSTISPPPCSKTDLPKSVFFFTRNKKQLVLILLLCVLVVFCHPLFLLLKKGYFFNQNFMREKPFCDMHTPNQLDCIPCPLHGICRNGHLACEAPQYRKEKRRGVYVCVKDQETSRQTEQLLEQVFKILSKLAGKVSCNEPLPDDAVPVLKTTKELPSLTFPSKKKQYWIGLTRQSIESRLNLLESVSLFPLEKRQLLYNLVFTELNNTASQQTVSSVHIFNKIWHHKTASFVNVYVSSQLDKSLTCQVKHFIYKVGIQIALFILLIVSIYKKYSKFKNSRLLYHAVYCIITENTSLQELQAGQAYAVGPRATDIFHLLHFGKAPELTTIFLKKKHYPQYFQQKFTKSITQAQVQLICEELVKKNPNVCRSVLYVDRVPFYFNKLAIQSFHMKNEQNTTQSKPIPF